MTPQRQKTLDTAIKAFFAQLREDQASLDDSSVTRFNLLNTGKIVSRHFLEYAGFKSNVAWEDDHPVLCNGCFLWSQDIPSEEAGLVYRIFLDLEKWPGVQGKSKDHWTFLRMEAYKASADYVTFEPIDRVPARILEELQAKLMLQAPCAEWGKFFPSVQYLMSIFQIKDKLSPLEDAPVRYLTAAASLFSHEGAITRVSSFVSIIVRPLLLDDDPEGLHFVMTHSGPSSLDSLISFALMACKPVLVRALLGAHLLIEWDNLDENSVELWDLIIRSAKTIQSPALTSLARRIKDANCTRSLRDFLPFLLFSNRNHSREFLVYLKAYCDECIHELGLPMDEDVLRVERLSPESDDVVALYFYVQFCLVEKKRDRGTMDALRKCLQVLIEQRAQQQDVLPCCLIPNVLWICWRCITYPQRKKLRFSSKTCSTWMEEGRFYPAVFFPDTESGRKPFYAVRERKKSKGKLFGRYPWKFQCFDFSKRKNVELRLFSDLQRTREMFDIVGFSNREECENEDLHYCHLYLNPQTFPANVRATVWQVELNAENDHIIVYFTLDDCHYFRGLSPTALRECVQPYRGIERSARMVLRAWKAHKFDEVQPKSFQPTEQGGYKGYSLTGTVLAIQQIVGRYRDPYLILTVSFADELQFGQIKTLPVLVPVECFEGVQLQIGESIAVTGELYFDCDEPTAEEIARARTIDPEGRELPPLHLDDAPPYYECIHFEHLKRISFLDLCKHRLMAAYGIGRVKVYKPNCQFVHFAARRADGGTDVYSVEIYKDHERIHPNPYVPKGVKLINMRLIKEGEWVRITYDGAPPARWPGVDEQKLQQQTNQNGKENG